MSEDSEYHPVAMLIGLLLFLGLAACGHFYERGRRDAQAEIEESRRRQNEDLRRAGYDPTPHHLPLKKDDV